MHSQLLPCSTTMLKASQIMGKKKKVCKEHAKMLAVTVRGWRDEGGGRRLLFCILYISF